jgi:hypothetical protein
MEFGAKLSPYVDSRGVELQDNAWAFTQPLGDSAAGFFKITILPQAIALEAKLPSNTLEWFEQRFEIILDEFKKTFRPAFVISSQARVIGTIPVNGDARVFLVEHLANMPSERFGLLHRPFHVFGIHLGMPPFQLQMPPKGKGKKGKLIPTEWAADVKIESLAEDTRQLYLDATGQWPPSPKKWDGRVTKESVTRLAAVKEYLEQNVLPFLTNIRTNGGKK